MNISQRQAAIVVIGFQLTTMIILWVGQIFSKPVDRFLTLGATLAMLIYGGMLFAYLRGWEYARHASVVLITLVVAAFLPEPFVTTYAPFLILLGPILALVLVDPFWVIGSAVVTVGILLIRAGGVGVYASLTTFLNYALLIAGLVVSRVVTETARIRVEKMEKALNESQARVTGIINSAMDAIISIDTSQRIVLFNLAAEKMFGYSADEITGQPLDLLMSEHHRGEHRRQIDQFGQTGITNRHMNGYISIKGVKKNGDEFLIDTSISQIDLGGEKFFTAILRDVTEHKRAEDALRASEYNYRSILEQASDGIFIADPGGRYVEINPSGCAMLGYTRDELLEKKMSDLISPEDLGKTPLRMDELRQGKVVLSERRMIRKDGSLLPVEISARMLSDGRLQGILRDITERKEAEEKLRATRELFQKSFHFSPLPAVLSKLLENTIIDVNSSFEELFGYTRAEMIGKPVSDYDLWVDASERERVAESLITSGRVQKHEFNFKTKSGRTGYGIFNAQVIEQETDKYVLTKVIDITERKQVDIALQQSEERFSKAFQANPAAMVITRMTDGYVIDVNESYEKIHGYRREELLGKTKLNLDIFDYLTDRQKIFEQLNQYGSIRSFETKLKTKSGEFRDVLFSLEIVEINAESCILAIFVDLTERKRAEDAISEAENRFRAMFEQAAVGIAQVGVDGKWLRANQRLCDIVGYTRVELLERTFQDITHPDDLETDLGYVRQLLANEIQMYSLEKRYIHKDGSFVWINLTVSLVYDLIGTPRYFITVVEDITQRKQAEEEIQRLKETLEERIEERTAQLATVNKELESFAYSVSHDLRSPLRGIDGWSLALLEDYGPILDEQGQAHIHKVRTEVQRMGMLIDDILKLSRITRAEMNKEKVDLSAIAEAIVNRLQETKPKDKQVEFVIQKGLTALGDPELLDIVLTNLLDNAFKFTGKLQEAHIEFGKTVVEGENTFFVRDNGAGFDMTYATNLFGAFQRMHRSSEFPGTGIGLATVQRIVTRHGGTIWASSEVDRGATFYFTLEDNDKSS